MKLRYKVVAIFLVVGVLVFVLAVLSRPDFSEFVSKALCVVTGGGDGRRESVCDGRDNDCNGLIDEEYWPLETTCGTGECRSSGFMLCSGGELADSCIPGQPSEEMINGRDNDCDGLIDE